MVDDLKAAARKAAFALRKQAFAAGQGQSAELLADYLAQFGDRVLAGYMPMRTEIDPLPAMAAHPGVVGVPVIMGAGLALRFAEWGPGVPMAAGAFGALVPQDPVWVPPQVVIVPLLAFDARGFRLGYGGGFYDRTLAGLPGAVRIGYAFAAQEVNEVPIDAFDQRLDVIVTEQGVREFSR